MNIKITDTSKIFNYIDFNYNYYSAGIICGGRRYIDWYEAPDYIIEGLKKSNDCLYKCDDNNNKIVFKYDENLTVFETSDGDYFLITIDGYEEINLLPEELFKI